MPSEGSVAPKERVNIIYKPATEGAQAEIELPLKLLVLGDFTGRADETPLEERKVVDVNADSFGSVMREQKLHASFAVPDRLSGQEGSDLAIELDFEGLRDFEPQAIARHVPELAKLLQLREDLTALKSPLANIAAFRKKIEALLQDDAQRDRILKELGALEQAAGGEGGEGGGGGEDASS